MIAFDPKVLILGSLPGDRSLKENQYYAHPQNRFWPVITTILNNEAAINYSERIELLQTNSICLWDVCKSANRPGSMDTDILEVVPNNIIHLLDQYPSISAILFNGQKARQLFDRYQTCYKELQYITLPSTSPANARFHRAHLIQAWSILSKLITSP